MENAAYFQISYTGDADHYAAKIPRFGHYAALYALVLAVGWIGAMKLTAYDGQVENFFMRLDRILKEAGVD